MGCDVSILVLLLFCIRFQSTHPGWGATLLAFRCFGSSLHFNPRTPGGVRRCARNQSITFPFISIHAPRVGCDVICYCINKERQTFQSTHPGWGATYRRNHCLSGHIRFQSTHPGWGATYYCAFPYNISFNFNPRTPGGVRQQKCIKDEMAFMFFCAYFSICM